MRRRASTRSHRRGAVGFWPRRESSPRTRRPSGCRKLDGSDTFWRIRIGDYRVIYEIVDAVLVVTVVKVGHRGDVYR